MQTKSVVVHPTPRTTLPVNGKLSSVAPSRLSTRRPATGGLVQGKHSVCIERRRREYLAGTLYGLSTMHLPTPQRTMIGDQEKKKKRRKRKKSHRNKRIREKSLRKADRGLCLKTPHSHTDTPVGSEAHET